MNLGTFTCPGHKDFACGRLTEKTCHFQKRCHPCAKEHKKEHRKAMRELYPEKDKKMHADYRENHREEAKALSAEWNKTHKEYIVKQSSQKNYKGMPFFDEWNPDKGGSFQAGADWIILNLGKRPSGSTLHIISHELGFVPGNLEWTHPRKQCNQQMFKIIAQQRHEIKLLKSRILELKRQLNEYKLHIA